MHVGAGIDLQVAEGGNVAVDARAVGEVAGVGDALILRHRNVRDAEQTRQQHIGGNGDAAEYHHAGAEGPVAARAEPQQAAETPEDQRHGDDLLGCEPVHGAEDDEARNARAGEVGEIHPPEPGAALEEDDAEEERTRQERQQVEHEIGEQPPFLRRVGDDENGVEGHRLRREISGNRQWTEQEQRRRRGAAPVPVEPALADEDDDARQRKAEQSERHYQRAEMRPAAHCEDAHDGDLQRDDRAGDQPHRHVERRIWLGGDRA